MSEFLVLVKLNNKNFKLSFPKQPTVPQVAVELAKQAKLGAELQVVLSVPDPDFPSETTVLKDDAALKNKQVLTGNTELKEVTSWTAVDCTERGKATLKDNGITPHVAACLVHMLGYSEPEDLQHVTEELLNKLPVKPLEKNRLVKLIDSVKPKGGSPARPPSARFAGKTAASPAKASPLSAVKTKEEGEPAAAGLEPTTPTVAATPLSPARVKPPEDEDDDALLARVLAEDDAEKGAAGSSSTAAAGNKSEQLVATLEGHTDSVLALAMTPDASTLFTASGDNTIKVWNLKGFFLVDTLTEHSTSVGVLAMDAKGVHLISGSGDGMVIVWDVADGKATKSFQDADSHAYGILAMTLANSKHLLFTATGDKKIRGFQVHYKKKKLSLAMEMSGHLESVRCMVLSPDDSVLYSASEDATIKEWHANAEVGYKFVRALRGHEGAVYGLAISKDGSTMVSCSGDKTVTVWRLTTAEGLKGAGRDLLPDGPAIKQVLEGHKGDINCVALMENGSKLVSAGDDKTIRVWSLKGKSKEPTFGLQHTLQGHTLIVYPVVVSKDGKTVVSGSADNTARVWSLAE